MNNPYIVAELSTSHNGEYAHAFHLIDAALMAGADAVKFQTYVPEDIAADTIIQSGPWAGRNYRDLYRQGKTPWEWHESLFTYARGLGLDVFSSPFSEKAVALLESIGCSTYKIASPEINHHALIKAAARTRKPMIISTGMATRDEIITAHRIAMVSGAKRVTLLHCVSEYPAKAEEFNLCTLRAMKEKFGDVGLSDHSKGTMVAVMAVALGATVIEKHLMLNRDSGGLDSAFSLEPAEFASMVKQCRTAARAMGTRPYERSAGEVQSMQYRRSIWPARPIKQGQVITEADLAILRPNLGIDPRYFHSVVGKTALCNIGTDTPLNWNLIK